jgi:hypothetical protein
METKKVSMGFSRTFPVDLVVYIDPIRYYEMPYRDKFRVRDLLSAVNWKLRGQGKRMLLLTPGRICTSSAELGVPSSFADISEFDMIAEISETRAGYVPELSYGSHIFQDLVEAEILYTAVFEAQSTLHFTPSLLEPYAASLAEYADYATEAEGMEGMEQILQVYDTGQSGLTLYYDMSQEHLQVSFSKEEKEIDS